MPTSLILPLLFSMASGPSLSPGELSPFLRVISASIGAPGRVACKDIDLAMQLKRDGLSPDAKAPLAFAASVSQIKPFLADGKLVVCSEEAGLKEGAAIVLLKERGRPILVASPRNASASGFTLSDSLLKIARVR